MYLNVLEIVSFPFQTQGKIFRVPHFLFLHSTYSRAKGENKMKKAFIFMKPF